MKINVDQPPVPETKITIELSPEELVSITADLGQSKWTGPYSIFSALHDTMQELGLDAEYEDSLNAARAANR